MNLVSIAIVLIPILLISIILQLRRIIKKIGERENDFKAAQICLSGLQDNFQMAWEELVKISNKMNKKNN
jgi:hypothetical protein